MRPFKFMVLLGALLPFFGMAQPFFLFEIQYQDEPLADAEVSVEDLRSRSLDLTIHVDDDAPAHLQSMKSTLEKEKNDFDAGLKKNKKGQVALTVLSWVPYLLPLVLILIFLTGIRVFDRGKALAAIFFGAVGLVACFMGTKVVATLQADLHGAMAGVLANNAGVPVKDLAFALDFGMAFDLVCYGMAIVVVGGLLGLIWPEGKKERGEGGAAKKETAPTAQPAEPVAPEAAEGRDEEESDPDSVSLAPVLELEEPRPSLVVVPPTVSDSSESDTDESELAEDEVSNVVGLGAGPGERYLPVVVPEDE